MGATELPAAHASTLDEAQRDEVGTYILVENLTSAVQFKAPGLLLVQENRCQHNKRFQDKHLSEGLTCRFDVSDANTM